MSTLGTILNTGRRALHTQQAAVQVTSQNIANAETEGYSRQRAVITPSQPVSSPWGNMGTGVEARGVSRVRDSLLDAAYRRDSGEAAAAGTQRDLLGSIEEVFGEPSPTGLASAFDQFWSAWSDLGNNPSSVNAKGVVRQRGLQVTSMLNGFAGRLDDLTESTKVRLAGSAAGLSQLAGQVAELNGQIRAAEVGGSEASDLRDARDLRVDQMAKLAGTRAVERTDGSVAVFAGGIAIVDGIDAKPVGVAADGGSLVVGSPTGPRTLRDVGGELGAVLEVLTADVPATRAELDRLAETLVTSTNAYHRTGWSPAGSGVDFFDAATTTAANVRLDSGVAGNPALIAAGRTPGATGDNAVALDIAGLRTSTAPFAGQSITDFYRQTVTTVAFKVSSAESSAAVYDTLAGQAETRRSSVSGVSSDEELAQLMRHQQAYAAATRIVSAVDEMTRSVLDLV